MTTPAKKYTRRATLLVEVTEGWLVSDDDTHMEGWRIIQNVIEEMVFEMWGHPGKDSKPEVTFLEWDEEPEEVA